MKKFQDLGLSPSTLKALEAKGFEEPTKIQQEVIPALLQGKENLIGQAQTGTGKTAAFGIPLIELLDSSRTAVQALILAPTRELAVQIVEEINSLKGQKRLDVMAVYGGQSIDFQLSRLKRGVDVVVGTPGRVMDHLERGSLKLNQIKYFILDEADEMLNMGFVEDIEFIFKHTNEEKRVLLFSATMPDRILKIAQKYMGDYKQITIKKPQLTTTLTEQIYFEVANANKFEALCRLIDMEDEFYGVVFCRTKVDVDELTRHLLDRGYDAAGLHGDITQTSRQETLRKFKQRKTTILVATDVAARGIDVHELTHVVNFSLPQDPESYVHRIGRTGRAGKQGTAITFVSPSEYRQLRMIQQVSKADIQKKSLPGGKDIVAKKIQKLKTSLTEILFGEDLAMYETLAEELLKDQKPKQLMAALLKHAFKDDLNVSRYNEIQESSINTKGTARLFVAMGRKELNSPKELALLIEQKAGVKQSRVRNVEIFDAFSFVTVSFEDAEIIIDAFARKAGGKRPLIQKAVAREKGGSRPSRSFSPAGKSHNYPPREKYRRTGR